MKPKRNIRKSVLRTAEAAVLQSRQKVYGGPERNFERIARLWNAHLQNRFDDAANTLTTVDVAQFLGFVKDARLVESPSHFDSWTDKAGYAACGAECGEAK